MPYHKTATEAPRTLGVADPRPRIHALRRRRKVLERPDRVTFAGPRLAVRVRGLDFHPVRKVY
ncbi:hypothetical protein JCM13591A_09080 [Microbacterium xylanilyticum]